MQEAFLHYIWRHQYFDKSDLQTDEGEKLVIQSPGFYNVNAGPDFQEARIEIDGILWSGCVEIHVKSSDWYQHHHEVDKGYDMVILHVVWENDRTIKRTDNSSIPTLELKKLINFNLIDRYKKLIEFPATSIPCEQSFSQINDLTKISMLDKLVMERLSEKSINVFQILYQTNGDWEETAYRLLIQSFGLKVNTDNFNLLGKSVPLKIIKKHNESLLVIESLLFGVAGFLYDDPVDNYQESLTKEFQYLSHKYDLPATIDKEQWKFMRLRPASFPTLRLAQLAAVLRNCHSVFKMFTEAGVQELREWLMSEPSSYWLTNYNFGKPSKSQSRALGNQMFDLIIINTIAPLLIAYGKQIDNQSLIDKSITLLENLKPENNNITRVYEGLGFKPKSAFDSQGLIQLNRHYCIKKRCLSCSIGTSILGAR